MSNSPIFGQQHHRSYFALFGRLEGVLIYLALAISMVLCFLHIGEFAESAALVAPLAVGFSMLAGLRFNLAGTIASALVAACVFWVAYAFDLKELPEQGLFFRIGLVLLICIFSFCASRLVRHHLSRGELAHKRENLLRQVLDSLPVGVWVRSRAGQTIFVNQRWADFSPYSQSQILESDSRMAPVDLGPGWEDDLSELLQSNGGSVQYRPIRLTDSEGNACAVNLVSLKIHIEHLEDFGSLSLLIDETAVRLRERQVEDSQLNLTLALENARMGLWDENLQTGKVLADKNWYQLIGIEYDPRMDPNGVWLSRLHPDDRERVSNQYTAYLKSPSGVFKTDYRIRTAEDCYIWVQDRVRVIEYEPDGSPRRIMGTIQDISDRKKIEIDLKQAKDHAEIANAAKGHFIAAISHEIRTPLNAIIGLSSFLAEGELDEENKDLAQTIHRSGKDLLDLVNDLLDFSKIEAGHIELEVEEYPIHLIFEDCVKLFKRRAAEKHISLDLKIEPNVTDYAMGDMQRLRQIVHNLLANAIKFTESGGVHVCVRRVSLNELPENRRPDPLETVGYLDQPDHEYLWVQVSDSGIGISQPEQALLFQAFSQVDSSANRKYEGTGLGLVICKRLVQAMGGKIWVQSEAGQGSEFSFVVRTKFMEEQTRVEDYTRSPFAPVERMAHQHPCAILIVGPQSAAQTLIASCRRLGYTPHHIPGYDLNGSAYLRKHYNLVFIWMGETVQALDFARGIHKDKAMKQPDSIVGFCDQGCEISLERCQLNGIEGLIKESPEPEAVRRIILAGVDKPG